jgi:hypothetical protein
MEGALDEIENPKGLDEILGDIIPFSKTYLIGYI